MWNMYDFRFGFFELFMFFPVVIMVLVVVLLIKLLQNNKKPSTSSRKEDDNAIVILRERFAKGEIDEEEFNKKMELLKK